MATQWEHEEKLKEEAYKARVEKQLYELSEKVKNIGTAIVTPQFVYHQIRPLEVWKDLQTQAIDKIEKRIADLEVSRPRVLLTNQLDPSKNGVYELGLPLTKKQFDDTHNNINETASPPPSILNFDAPHVRQWFRSEGEYQAALAMHKEREEKYGSPQPASQKQELEHIQDLYNKRTIEVNKLQLVLGERNKRIKALELIVDEWQKSAQFWYDEATRMKIKYESLESKSTRNVRLAEEFNSNLSGYP